MVSSSPTVSLKDFCRQNDTNFNLGTVNQSLKQAVWEQCVNSLTQNQNDVALVDVITSLRILTRDEAFRSQFSEGILSKLVQYIDPIQSVNFESGICLESLKALSNIIFKQSNTITYLKSIGILSHSIELIKICHTDPNKRDLVLIALKIVFLISGLDSSTRFEFADHLNAFDVFLNLFNSVDKSHLTIADTELILEGLKAIFNILFIVRNREDLKTRFNTDISRMVAVARDFLICPKVDGDRLELISRIVHLLTVSPRRCYKFLLFPIPMCSEVMIENNDIQSDSKEITERSSTNSEMKAIDVLLEFLKVQLESYQPDRPLDASSNSNLRLDEALCPVLNVMTRLCQSSRTIRKYCRLKILPHLGNEVTRLPEEGSTIRNRLCKLLTHPLADVSELAAVLVFVLCKENIGRAVKYTGFGNFAGFLARHALLRQSKNRTRQNGNSEQGENDDNVSEEDYSLDSSESDTEEYNRLKDQINPVTGRWEEPKTNPMDEMTDEQKEYLAMELVEKIDNLQRSGVIQPGTVGEDGRVRPVGHILELLNQNGQGEARTSDDESD